MSTLTRPRDTESEGPATVLRPAGGLIGLWPLTRLALRRGRIWWPAWIVFISVQVVATAGAYESLYPTPQSRSGLGAAMGQNTSLRALYGRAFDLTSAGGFTAWRMGGFAAAIISLMSLLAVVRHTRAEEEAGRLELLRSGVVGRHAPLAAALLVTIGANVILAGIVIAGLIFESTSMAGALALGLGFMGCGIVFAGVGAVTSQISENARPARGMAASVLGAAYLLRAVGDSSDTAPWLSWLSPIGWSQQMRPFADERWWVLGMSLVVGVGLIVLAVVLEGRRDFGAGLRPAPLGPNRAAPRLATAGALAWRLQRGSWLAWTIGIAIFAGAIGSVANGVLDIFKGNPQLEEIIRRIGGEQSLIDAFFAAVLPVMATVGTIHSVQAMLRLRSEETETRVEQVLGTAVTRTRLMASHLVHALASPPILMTAVGLSAGGAYAASVHDASKAWAVLGGALVLVPAMWVFSGVTMALIGMAPERSVLAWGVLAACGFLGQLGPILQLPDMVLRISPFANVPKFPGTDLDIVPLAALSVIAIALTTAGIRGFQRRDIG
ncbi:MAG TPA: ABC transporter permease [Dermatophilaceae bacterium]